MKHIVACSLLDSKNIYSLLIQDGVLTAVKACSESLRKLRDRKNWVINNTFISMTEHFPSKYD